VWSAINAGLNSVFDLLLWPLQGAPANVQIVALALPTAALAIVAYRFTSNQAGIAATKSKIAAYLLELRLFRDDLGVMLLAQGRVFRHVLAYLGHAVVPMAVVFIPIVLILIHVESRYAFRGLEAGESTILSVTLESGEATTELPVALQLPSGLVQETAALRVDSTHEIHWRIRAERSGEHRIGITVGGKEYATHVVVGDGKAVSPYVYRANDPRSLLYPKALPLESDGAIAAIHLRYPRARDVFAGLSTASWLLFGTSLVFGFVLGRCFGVDF